MAIYSKKISMPYLPLMASSAGTISKDSYLLVEVTGVTVNDRYTNATIKYSLYAKSTTARSVTASISTTNSSVSKTVKVTTSMTCILTATETVSSSDMIDVYTGATISYEVAGSYMPTTYGVSSMADIMSSNYILFVTFGKMTSYPFAMKYGETGTFTFNKSSAYRLEFLDASGVSRYTASISGMSGSTAVPVSVFSTVKASLKTCKVYEIYSGTDIAEKSYNLTVSETACSLSLSALRSPTDADASLVTVSVSGESALSSTSRTVTVYAKETSSEIWNAVGTISPSASQFTGETMSVDLDISYSWDIYGILSDGYTSAQSNIFRIYSKSYIMDVRTDGKGIAFGGTAATEDEMYCGFGSFRANNGSFEGSLSVSGDIKPGRINGIADLIYPVGAIYMSVSSASPANLFGGTWEQIQDRFLLSAGSSYGAGSSGGSADAVVVYHNHSQNQHRHEMLANWSDGTGSTSAYTYQTNRKSTDRYTSYVTATNNPTGVDGTGKNMPPYLAVYVWKRTA